MIFWLLNERKNISYLNEIDVFDVNSGTLRTGDGITTTELKNKM
jgi:hypothetical protein